MPDRILRAIERPTIDHRGPLVRQDLGLELLESIKEIFQTKSARYHIPNCNFRNRSVGSLTCQHALARRSGTDVRYRALRQHMARQAGREAPALMLNYSMEAGGRVLSQRKSSRRWWKTRTIPSSLCAWSTTIPPPASPPTSPQFAKQSIAQDTPPSSSWTR